MRPGFASLPTPETISFGEGISQGTRLNEGWMTMQAGKACTGENSGGRGLRGLLSVIPLILLAACSSWFRREEPRAAHPAAVVATEETGVIEAPVPADELAPATVEPAAPPTEIPPAEAPTPVPTPTPAPTPEPVAVVPASEPALPEAPAVAPAPVPTPVPAARPLSPTGLLSPGDAPILSNPFRAGRSMTMSRHGIVASSHVFASEAGVQVLRNGGNAMDAAIAAAATLAVVEPMMTGLGGDVWILYYDAATRKVYALNGSGRSPRELSREYFRHKAKEEIDPSSWESATVPGALDAWVSGLERFGSRPLAELLEPAIRYADEGFPVTEIIGSYWKSFAAGMKEDPMAASTYLVGGEAPAIGSVFRNPRLANTLRQIAGGGRDAFYRGPIAKEIVRYAQATGGFLTLKDFEDHRSTWVEPLHVNYRGFDVYECPPNGQGIAVLLMLNILENFDIPSMKPQSPELLHLLLETKKLAFADVEALVSDPLYLNFPPEDLLSEAHAAQRASMIDLAQARDVSEPTFPTGSDTVYLCTIDAKGNAVSLINSVFAGFGSKRVGGETGIVMQNRGSGFNLIPGHPNEYAPAKLPFHTIIPGMVTRGDRLYMTFGVMGGDYQPQGHVQLLVNHLDFGYSIQEAISMPRWLHQGGRLSFLEYGTPESVAQGLRDRGHTVRGGSGGLFGGAQAILVDPVTGTYFGASDPRKDGAALGY